MATSITVKKNLHGSTVSRSFDDIFKDTATTRLWVTEPSGNTELNKESGGLEAAIAAAENEVTLVHESYEIPLSKMTARRHGPHKIEVTAHYKRTPFNFDLPQDTWEDLAQTETAYEHAEVHKSLAKPGDVDGDPAHFDDYGLPDGEPLWNNSFEYPKSWEYKVGVTKINIPMLLPDNPFYILTDLIGTINKDEETLGLVVFGPSTIRFETVDVTRVAYTDSSGNTSFQYQCMFQFVARNPGHYHHTAVKTEAGDQWVINSTKAYKETGGWAARFDFF